MVEIVIVRTDNVVVDTVGSNTYGDMVFTVKSGKAYKISNKRLAHFKMIQPNTAVTLSFAMSTQGTEYVAKAVSVAGQLPPPTIPYESPPDKKPTPAAPTIRDNMEWKSNKIEEAFWWKECGKMIIAQFINKDNPQYALYFLKMAEVLLKGKEDTTTK